MSPVWLSTSVQRFLGAPSGAVTAEWVVLSAALVGLTLAMFGAVRTGSTDLARDVGASLSAVGDEAAAPPAPLPRPGPDGQPDAGCLPTLPACTGTGPQPLAHSPGDSLPVPVAPAPPEPGAPRG